MARLSRQAGVFSVLGAATLMLALVSLVLALDSGRLFMEQRKLQKLADTAALEAVARLEHPTCADNALGAAQIFAKENADLNGFSSGTITAECVSVEPINGINVVVVEASGNAVQTVATETVPASLILRTGKLFGFNFDSNVTLQAQAVADRSSEPTVVFSIGAQLLRLENNKLLGSLLATVGLNPDAITLIDSNGLANASITPAGLLKELGLKLSIPELKVLSPDELIELVNTEVGLVSIEELIKASVNLVGNDTAEANASALSSNFLSQQLGNIKLNLLATENSPGLLSLASGRNGEMGAALDAQLKLGDILKTAILTGVHGRSIQVPELNIINAVKVELGIVEPPSLAAGPVGTTAYNAQIRLYADIDSDKLPIIGLLTKILGVRVNLPLAVDVVTAQAEFVSAQCQANSPTATFDINSTLLNTCIGNIPDELKWSGSARCEQNLVETELIKLLHLPVLSGKTHIPSLSQKNTLTNLIINPKPDIRKNNDLKYFTPINEPALGATTENIVVGLLDVLGGLFRAPQLVANGDLHYAQQAQNTMIANLASSYLESTKKNGFYDVAAVTKLILAGSSDQLTPPLVEADWFIGNSIPKNCLLFVCPPSEWRDGNFSSAFHAYTSTPYSLLDVVGIPTLGKGFQSCAGLLSSLLNWNNCVKHNLTKLFQEKPGGLDLIHINDGNGLLDPSSQILSCNGRVCLLVKPLLTTLKPILNDVGKLLTSVILDETLGLELGRSALAVHEINCGAPRLVSLGSANNE